MSANIEAKKQIVEEIKSKIAKSKSLVLVNNNGINVAQDTELRAAARKANVEYKVYKNNQLEKTFLFTSLEIGINERITKTTNKLPATTEPFIIKE